MENNYRLFAFDKSHIESVSPPNCPNKSVRSNLSEALHIYIYIQKPQKLRSTHTHMQTRTKEEERQVKSEVCWRREGEETPREREEHTHNFYLLTTIVCGVRDVICFSTFFAIHNTSPTCILAASRPSVARRPQFGECARRNCAAPP